MTQTESVSNGTSYFFGLPESRQHIIALLILFLIPFILFTATTIGGKEFQRHDITQWRAGAESVIEYRETYDKEPLWVNNMFGGMPAFVVSVKTAVPHLDRLSSVFSNIYPAFQYWVLLSGTYFLLIIMGFRSLTSVFGSLMYGLTTYFPIIIAAGHTSKFVALGFAPWMIAGFWLLLKKKKMIPGLLLFTVALTLELRAGHPQITYYFFYLLGFLWLHDLWEAIQQKRVSEWAQYTGLLAVGTLVGIMGHAQSILTLQEYSPFSIRGGSALDNSTGLESGYAFAWSQGIKETLTLWLPDLFGGASPDYWGSKPGTAGPHYFGVLSLPFILTALFKQRSGIMYTFFAAGTLGVLFAWGGNFTLLNEFAFDYIPYFDKFRAPETWLAFTSFCYMIVAVYGLEWILDKVKEKGLTLNALALPFGVSAAIVLALFLMVNSMNYSKPGEVQNIASQIARQNQVSPQDPRVEQQAQQYVNQQLVPAREEKAGRDAIRLILIFALGAAIVWLMMKEKISLTIGTAGLLLIAAFDMISVDKRYIPERVIVSGNVSPERTLESQKRDIDTYIQDNIMSEQEYPNRVLPLLDNAFNNATPSYFYPSLGGYTGAKLSVIQDVIDQNGPLFQGPQGLNTQLLSLLNVKFMTYQDGLNLTGFSTAYQGQSGTVYENENLFPKAFFVDSVITVQEPAEAYSYLSPGKADLSKTAIVETTEELSSFADSTANAVVTYYTGPEIDIETRRDKPGFLVISEIWYPAGWKATIDGKPSELYKTDYLLRGIPVSAGAHKISLRFEPDSYSLGVKLSWASLIIQLILGGIWGLVWLRGRNQDGA
ncbi:YfhO family protein [Balneola sp. MJW-20]|uniref:YfhO family protein n=1 Tax=Gracilimonas aurantiaca TaxID=3234185 RepID=UPI003467D29E